MTGWNRHGRKHADFPTSVRRQAERDLPHRCAGCGRTDAPLRLDHIRPGSRGGTHTLDNAQWLCDTCHDRKTRREAAEGQAIRTAKRTLPKRQHPLDAILSTTPHPTRHEPR